MLCSLHGGGTFQTAGEYESGKQALYAGNYPTALGYFQQAAKNSQRGIRRTLRLGILTYVGQTQYLTGNYAGARQLSQRAFAAPERQCGTALPWPCGNWSGNRQAALGHIENGMKGIVTSLNYVTTNFAYSFG